MPGRFGCSLSYSLQEVALFMVEDSRVKLQRGCGLD